MIFPKISKNPSKMPVLFVGHGSPMNAIEDNAYSQTWRELGKNLPRPKAILCVSAHWETWGVSVTAMEKPRTIHDFGGFPEELYQIRYPAPGNPALAADVQQRIGSKAAVNPDQDWGLDHGCWSVLSRMFPDADVPVIQLSLDHVQSAQFHYDLGKELAPLREKGIIIVGSGNMVHNLGRIALRDNNPDHFNEPFGLDWAMEAHEHFMNLISQNRIQELIDYPTLGKAVQLAVPTPEHYLPLLYTLALKTEEDTITPFNDTVMAGSLAMTSLLIT